MPRAKDKPAARSSRHAHSGSEALNATIARTAPAVLDLLADGVPRTKAAVIEALAGQYARDEITLTLIRLAATGQVVETGGRYTLATPPEP